MKAELIAVGSELVHFGRRDTNSDWLGDALLDLGIPVDARAQVADDPGLIESAVRAALARAPLVIVSGGIGPTGDDRTREAVARALDLPLERDGAMVERLEARFRERGFRFSDAQARQAERPRGSVWLDNRVGAAPGFVFEGAGHTLVVLPGVPAELRAMFSGGVAPRLSRAARDASAIARRVLKVAGRTESSVDEAIRDVYDEPGVDLTVLARTSGIEVVLQTRAASSELARRRLDPLVDAVAGRLGRDVFGRDDDTLAGVTGRLLERAGRTLATAESCTAGSLAAAVTEIPGSSGWFRGGLVTYSNDLKESLAGVPAETLRAHGAVSAEVARVLAEGARARCRADLGVGVTGVAGPGGGTPDKPVGLVFVAVADDAGTVDRRLRLPGDRDLVRRRSVTAALDLARRRLEGWV